MANIASQKKRNARTLRERDENRRFTSAIKTYFRRLEAAVAQGDAEAADAEYKVLSLEDRQGGPEGRIASQRRCPQEVARGAHSRLGLVT